MSLRSFLKTPDTHSIGDMDALNTSVIGSAFRLICFAVIWAAYCFHQMRRIVIREFIDDGAESDPKEAIMRRKSLLLSDAMLKVACFLLLWIIGFGTAVTQLSSIVVADTLVVMLVCCLWEVCWKVFEDVRKEMKKKPAHKPIAAESPPSTIPTDDLSNMSRKQRRDARAAIHQAAAAKQVISHSTQTVPTAPRSDILQQQHRMHDELQSQPNDQLIRPATYKIDPLQSHSMGAGTAPHAAIRRREPQQILGYVKAEPEPDDEEAANLDWTKLPAYKPEPLESERMNTTGWKIRGMASRSERRE